MASERRVFFLTSCGSGVSLYVCRGVRSCTGPKLAAACPAIQFVITLSMFFVPACPS